MLITDTYLVINKIDINNFRKIKQFKLDLGASLTNNENKFIPNDPIMQKHYMFFDQIITKTGSIGNLQIYSNFKTKQGYINIYNEKDMLEYKIDSNISLYDNINNCLDTFFTEHNLNDQIKPETKKEEKEEKEESYIKPDKELKDMTMEERIEYARNRN